MYREDK